MVNPESEMAFILWAQQALAGLIPFLQAVTNLGSEEFYLLLAPAILWCWNYSAGLRLGLFLMANNSLNAALKLAFQLPRPYWVDRQVQAFAGESSFGLPSGHAQNAVVVWGALAQTLRRGWAWIAAVLLILLIGVSRMALGVHFPSDVLTGWLIGAGFLAVLAWLEDRLRPALQRATPGGAVLWVLAGTAAVLAAPLLAASLHMGWTLPAEWAANAAASAGGATPLEPTSLEGAFTFSGTFLGLGLGAVWLRMLGMRLGGGKTWQLAGRYGIGLVGVLLFWRGLGMFLPGGENLVAYALRFMRYALIGYWVSGLAPWVFIRLRLVTKT
jgi:membrane-associated phospholipid phosphatase